MPPPETRPRPLPKFSARSVVLVGGGRWGRVHAGVLKRVLPHDGRLLWVSHHNRAELERHLADQDETEPQGSMMPDLRAAMRTKPDAAIIVTAPNTHGAVAREVLEAGVPALVEKPLALDAAEAQGLVELAARQKLVLGLGLHLLLTSYLKHFRLLCQERRIASAHLTWLDPETEQRYGEMKRADLSTPKIHDIYPHLFAILRVLVPGASPQIHHAYSAPLGAARLSLSVGDSAVTVELSRRAPQRVRRIDLVFADGGSASLDFTQEPGTVTIDGHQCESDPDWAIGPSPLAVETASFLAVLDNAGAASTWPCLAANVMGSVTGAVETASKLRESEARALADGLASGRNPVTDPDLHALIVDNLVPPIAGATRLDAHQFQDHLVEEAMAALAANSAAPPEEGALRPVFQGRPASEFLLLVREALLRR